MTKVLVLTHDTLGRKMAGPAIRALEIARTLSTLTEVTLVSVTSSTLDTESFPVNFVTEDQLRKEVENTDVLIFQGFTLYAYPWISETDTYLVADLYDPINFEILVQNAELPGTEQEHTTRVTTESLTKQLERADFMICASEKQRDLWLGHLGSLCRVNHLTYRSDPSLRDLIDVVPFGVQDKDPVLTKSRIRGVVPGISATDKVIIWGGGIYNWFDPLTLIRAVKELSETRDDIRLFFLGVQHPNPQVPAMRAAADAFELAGQLDLLDSHVFFNQEWVKYEDRADYLLDSDLGVSTHYEHIETAFSFRTRILDYFWAGLPSVCTEGDSLAITIETHELGITVPSQDVKALSLALEKMLYDDEARALSKENVQRFRRSMRWSETLRPLVNYCLSPRHAADYASPVFPIRELERRNLLQTLQSVAAQLAEAQSQLEAYKVSFLRRVVSRSNRIAQRFLKNQ